MGFLWVITLLELTNFSGVTILETSLIGIKGTGTESTCVKGANVGDIFFAQSACIKGAFINSACAKITCIGSASTVEQSGIDLKSFGILKVKLFGT